MRLEVNETGLQTLGFLQDVVQAGTSGSTVANGHIYFPGGRGDSRILPSGSPDLRGADPSSFEFNQR